MCIQFQSVAFNGLLSFLGFISGINIMASDTLQLLRNSLNLTNLTPNSSPVKSAAVCEGSNIPTRLPFSSELYDAQSHSLQNPLMALANIIPTSQGQLTAAFLPDGTMTLLQPVASQHQTTHACQNLAFPPLSPMFPDTSQKQTVLSTTSLPAQQNVDRKSHFTQNISKHSSPDRKDKSLERGSKIRQVSDKLLTSTVLQLPSLPSRTTVADTSMSANIESSDNNLLIGNPRIYNLFVLCMKSKGLVLLTHFLTYATGFEKKQQCMMFYGGYE